MNNVLSNRDRREQLYNQYAENLKLIKTAISLEPDIEDTIICPICFRLFERTDLDSSQVLTLDHIPPRRLGGQNAQGVLLCGVCNHNLGSKLDAAAVAYLATKDFIDNVPGSSKEGFFSFHSSSKLVAEFHYDDMGRLHINRNRKRINPTIGEQEAEYLQSIVDKVDNETTAYIQFSDKHPRIASIAWLRYAYLIFFRWFGYSGILHKNFDTIRKQIINPSESLLPYAWEPSKAKFTALPVGIHVIQKPRDFQAFVIVFDTNTGLRIIRKAIILPSLMQPGVEIYDRLLSLSSTQQEVNIEGIQLPQYPEFWTSLRACHFGLIEVFNQ